MAGSVAAVAGAALVLPLSGMAGAAAPQIGILLTPGSGGGTALPTSPIPTITDQTTVEVQVPANTTLTGGAVKILECGDADGLADDLPTNAAGCDGLTINTGKTINEGAGGTVDKTNYEIFALPSTALNEGSTSTPVCNATSACVLYIGQNQNDFTQPYVWSQPFYVAATVGTPTPESPITIVLPAAGILILGAGTAFTVRRRRRSAAEAAA
jgi:hypothetical protein